MNKLTKVVALASLCGASAFIACGSEFGGPEPGGAAGAAGGTGVAAPPSSGGASMASAGAPSNGGASSTAAGAQSNTGATPVIGGAGAPSTTPVASRGDSGGGCSVGLGDSSGAALLGVAIAVAAGLARRRRHSV